MEQYLGLCKPTRARAELGLLQRSLYNRRHPEMQVLDMIDLCKSGYTTLFHTHVSKRAGRQFRNAAH